MIKLTKTALVALSGSFLVGCGATTLVSTPVENIDALPLKVIELTDAEKQSWGHKDLLTDTIPGMSVEKAYADILKNKKGSTVIVAVLDSGMDLDHEDLDGVLWTNTKEIPNNGKDDDNNGFVDDVHGYNFLGDSYNEQLEYARMLRLKVGDAASLAKAQKLIDEEYPKTLQQKQQYDQMYLIVGNADKAVKKELGRESYTKQDLAKIQTTDQELLQYVGVLKQMYQYEDSIDEVLAQLKEGVAYFTEKLNYNINVDFNGREVVGDNPYDLTDVNYGNGNPKNLVEDESHGTHVAGIIAAERNNGIGVDGVANNVKIMSIRAVPNGDEYDKDIARGIRYAVDNGAAIINCSFGKSFSPKAEWVYDAITYAASKNVLIVHAAGNDGNDLDNANNPNFPNDHKFMSTEFTDNVITVGALSPSYGSKMIASFSNYGSQNVDVFAPGDNIYSTMPNNKYEFQGGTSMAAPAVSGVAALLKGQYPQLNAKQLKQILMQSGITTKTNVILAGEEGNTKPFKQASKSGKMVNAYNALIMADNFTKGKINLDQNAK
ncbi:peptidase S8 [Croceivirga radicis]|uniref:Peptidase S8 n=1 Tax=Croceivirga radicis TaxID=1929488 RepID=A0A1V6LVT5_9FLAO|nr:S8 family peptidase [Croceivirga radicis]OQD44290.1 peptidase S8 [Croceivirga radicis]